MRKKLFAAAAAASMAVSSAAVLPGNAESSGSSPEKIRIMAVGDSITDGYWETGGYRKYMYCTLEDLGCTGFDLVGPKGADRESFTYNGKEREYDGNYAGYSGYAIQYMTGTETRQGIYETLKSGNYIKEYSPDIVLLQIGTNDILSAYNDGITDRLESLVSYILSESGDSGTVVFVSTIPDIDAVTVSDWLWAYGEKKWNSTPEEFADIIQGHIDSYNASIPVMVEKMRSEGKNVRFADIHSVVDMQTDLYDGVHPNEQGYEKMGKYWADLLYNYFQEDISTTQPSSGSPEEYDYSAADAVKLGRFILGRSDHGITPEENDKFDVIKDNTLDVFDLIRIKQLILT
ncbi:MAG: hypothetical protein IKQ90_06845 [Ruminococcus sp.]|nr:hypothetical protein [Ruminococcus sp.]